MLARSRQHQGDGKNQRDEHTPKQAAIRDLLIAEASAGASEAPVAAIMLGLLPDGRMVTTIINIEGEQVEMFADELARVTGLLINFATELAVKAGTIAEVIPILS